MTVNLATNDHLRVRVYCSYQEQISINVSWYRWTTVSGVVTLPEATGAMDSHFRAAYRACMATGSFFRGVGCQVRNLAGWSYQDFSTVGAEAGLVAGDHMPGQIAGLVSLKSERGGPAFRARKYIPFASEGSNNADGEPSVTYVAALDTVADLYCQRFNIAGAGGAGGVIPVMRFLSTLPDDELVFGQARVEWASQRRRSDFGAKNSPFPL